MRAYCVYAGTLDTSKTNKIQHHKTKAKNSLILRYGYKTYGRRKD